MNLGPARYDGTGPEMLPQLADGLNHRVLWLAVLVAAQRNGSVAVVAVLDGRSRPSTPVRAVQREPASYSF